MADNIIKSKKFQYIYVPLLFVAACLINVFKAEIYGAALFLLLASVLLVVSSRLTDAMLPVLLVTVFVTKLYDVLGNETYKTQLTHVIWVAIPVVASVIFHFIYYKKPFKKGRSFYGICAISAALILGGLGTIPAKDYFSPTALFYVFALGIGMVIFYLLIKSQFTSDAGAEVAKNMYVMGLLACFCVIMFYVRDWDKYVETREYIYFQSKNNLSTFLMLALPFPVLYAVKNPVHILSTFVMYVCIIYTGSRGGFLMGTIELFLILLAYVLLYPKNREQRIVSLTCSAILGVGVICCLPFISKLYGITGVDGEEVTFRFSELIGKLKGYIVKVGEARYRLFGRMFDDFKANPLFGVGIGYKGNQDIYNPTSGAMNWYHMWFAQVIGGLGITGILAYGYQLVDRVIIFIKNRSNIAITMFLSYIGLFLMSQVNPGEFCPVPYAMLAVTFFAIMEKDPAREAVSEACVEENTEVSEN